MIRVGILGNIERLDSFITALKKTDNVIILGKTSSGISSKLDDVYFTIPEKNKVVLFDENDVLIVEDIRLISFEQIKNAIKKDKSIYFLNYPNFSTERYQELLSLSYEAQTVVYFHNPYAFTSSLQKLLENITSPFYLDVNYSNNNFELNDATILPFLLLSKTIRKDDPKKISATLFCNKNIHSFLNIRMNYSDTSTINYKLWLSDSEKLNVEYFNDSNTTFIDLKKRTKKANIDKEQVAYFIEKIRQKTELHISLEQYIAALKLKTEIEQQLSIEF